MNEVKNKNLFIRVSKKEKNIIELNAEKCGLSVSEYLRQRALGYMPRAVLPEVFFSFNDKLDELCVACEGEISPDTKVRRFGEDNFTMKIGGTTYEVSTHFNPKGRQKKKSQRCTVDYRLMMTRKTPSQIP